MSVKLPLRSLVRVRDALTAAFPSHAQLADTVTRVIADLAVAYDPWLPLRPGKFGLVAFDLVRTWQARGLMADLIAGAARAAPFNPDLQSILRQELASLPAVETAALQGFVSEKYQHLDAVSWVDTLSKRMRAVCRVDFVGDSPPGIGTGFLVDRTLVLTAHHVVERLNPSPLLAETAVCRFEYLNDSDRPGKVVRFMLPQWKVASSPPGGIETIVGGAEPGPDELDFALVRLDSPVDTEPFGFAAVAATRNDSCIVLQHPRRAALRVAFGQVTGHNPSGTRLRHNAGTEAGSSGAPCLNLNLEVVGLHNATRYAPQGTLAEYNTAVPIPRIGQALAAKNIHIAGASG